MKYVGSYELLKPLASGGMAEVFLARSAASLNHGKIVALKRTLPDFLDSPELCQMFLDEIRVGACLNHQNIVQVRDFGQVDNQAFLVMEYIHGVPLRELIAIMRDRHEFLELPFVLYIIKETAEALEYAYHHAIDPNTGQPLKLIHRDISPQNIMLSFEGEVKVIDFGISKATAASGQTQHGTIKGKVAYMSPEQALRKEIDSRSDLFSLGILLWELLANRRFFAGRTAQDVKQAVREYVITNEIFEETDGLRILRPVMEKLLHHDPDQRYDRARDLCDDIQYILNKNFPSFSSLEFAIFLKNIFYERYDRSLREMKALILGENTRTDKIEVTKTENTVPSKTQKTIRTIRHIISPELLKPRLSPLVTPPLRFFSKPKRVAYQEPPAAKEEASAVFTKFLGFFILFAGLFIVYKHHGAKIRMVATSHLGAVDTAYVEVTLNSSAGASGVKLDGQIQNRATPLTLKLVKDQRYQIEVYHPGYLTRSFYFSPTRDSRYKIMLQPLPTPTRRGLASASAATPKTLNKKKIKKDSRHKRSKRR